MPPLRISTAVIGAGMAGLASCLELERALVDWHLFEADAVVGGRMRTERTDGFLLDVGFHVLLTAYPAWGETLDLGALNLRSFDPGARIWTGRRMIAVNDPRRRPTTLLATATAPIGTWRDKWQTLQWRRAVAVKSVAELERTAPPVSALAHLQAQGFTPRMIERFWRPFFGGVLLDASLSQPAGLVDFVFKMFGAGEAALPAAGIGAVPAQLVRRLPLNRVHCEAPVRCLAGRTLELASGERVEAERVIVATEADAAARLLPEWSARPRSLGATCHYFAAPRDPVGRPLLVLNGSGTGVVNNLSVNNRVQPTYGPPDQALIAVTCLQPADAGTVQAELRSWFGPAVEGWTPLRRFDLPAALPVIPLERPGDAFAPIRPGVWLTGDHRSLPTVHHAIEHGRKTAQSTIADRHPLS